MATGLKTVLAQLANKARRRPARKPKRKVKSHGPSMDTVGDNIVKGTAVAQGTLKLVGDPISKAVKATDVKTGLSGLVDDVKAIPAGQYFKAMEPRIEAH